MDSNAKQYPANSQLIKSLRMIKCRHGQGCSTLGGSGELMTHFGRFFIGGQGVNFYDGVPAPWTEVCHFSRRRGLAESHWSSLIIANTNYRFDIEEALMLFDVWCHSNHRIADSFPAMHQMWERISQWSALLAPTEIEDAVAKGIVFGSGAKAGVVRILVGRSEQSVREDESISRNASH